MDFLTFNSFISIKVLIIFYYMGAVVFPVGMWSIFLWGVNKYQLAGLLLDKKKVVWSALSGSQKSKLIALFAMMFLFMQLFWRMLFEYLIAFMQMRDALLQLKL